MSNEWSPGYLGRRGESAGDIPVHVEPIPHGSLDAALADPVTAPEPGSDVVFAGLNATAGETTTTGPYPRTRIRYHATGQHEWVPTDALRPPGKGVTLSRFQLEEWAGYPLTDEQVDRLAAAFPKSSIPEAVNEIAFAITGGRPELNGDDCG